jgi:hypothetical protein
MIAPSGSRNGVRNWHACCVRQPRGLSDSFFRILPASMGSHPMTTEMAGSLEVLPVSSGGGC